MFIPANTASHLVLETLPVHNCGSLSTNRAGDCTIKGFLISSLRSVLFSASYRGFTPVSLLLPTQQMTWREFKSGHVCGVLLEGLQRRGADGRFGHPEGDGRERRTAVDAAQEAEPQRPAEGSDREQPGHDLHEGQPSDAEVRFQQDPDRDHDGDSVSGTVDCLLVLNRWLFDMIKQFCIYTTF